MNKLSILFFLFLLSCTNQSAKNDEFINFGSFEKMSFSDFKLKLNQYVKSNSFPDLNE
jgi:hypothetical protein